MPCLFYYVYVVTDIENNKSQLVDLHAFLQAEDRSASEVKCQVVEQEMRVPFRSRRRAVLYPHIVIAQDVSGCNKEMLIFAAN